MRRIKYVDVLGRGVFQAWYVFLILAGVIAAVIGFIVLDKPPLCDKCNVVLISIDTLSALHLPCYGYQRNTAPNLCAYADKNILFLNSYSQSPITIDSHFSIFTSLYPHTHKMTDIVGDSINENYLTLAEIFRMEGYQTIYHGPTIDPHLPLNRGIERGFDIIGRHPNKNFNDNWKNVYQRLIENTAQKIPSFFFLHTYAVHYPYLTGHKQKHLFTDLPEYPHIALTEDEYRAIS